MKSCTDNNTFCERPGVYDDEYKGNQKVKSANETRQQILRHLPAEVIIRESLYGEVVVIQSDLAWFAAGMPHSKVSALLWFLVSQRPGSESPETPLRMSDALDAEVRIRRCGLSMADALEKLLGEVVLFALGAAVNRESNTMLYRFHDDFWLCGEPTVCAKAWTTIKQFATIMGLEFNKTGSAYISTGSGVGKAVVQLI